MHLCLLVGVRELGPEELTHIHATKEISKDQMHIDKVTRFLVSNWSEPKEHCLDVTWLEHDEISVWHVINLINPPIHSSRRLKPGQLYTFSQTVLDKCPAIDNLRLAWKEFWYGRANQISF